MGTDPIVVLTPEGALCAPAPAAVAAGLPAVTLRDTARGRAEVLSRPGVEPVTRNFLAVLLTVATAGIAPKAVTVVTGAPVGNCHECHEEKNW